MVRHSFLFLVIALVPVITLVSDYIGKRIAFSVIPGWHTTIYPPLYIAFLVQVAWLCLLPVLYRLLERRNAMISQTGFMLHVAMTLTCFINLYSGFGYYEDSNTKWLSVLPIIVFVLGQLMFLVMAMRATRHS